MTAWPFALAAASTFDRSAIRAIVEAVVVEQKGKGVNVLLGPMMNIARIPTGIYTFDEWKIFQKQNELSRKVKTSAFLFFASFFFFPIFSSYFEFLLLLFPRVL